MSTTEIAAGVVALVLFFGSVAILAAAIGFIVWRFKRSSSPASRTSTTTPKPATPRSSALGTLEQLVEEYQARKVAIDLEIAQRAETEARLVALFSPKGQPQPVRVTPSSG